MRRWGALGVTFGLLALVATGCDFTVVDEKPQVTPPGNGTWAQLSASPLPAARQSGTLTALESLGLLQFIGGFDGAAAQQATYILDLSTGLWTAGNLLPTASGSLSRAVTPAGDIVALGGANGGGI